MIIVQGTRLSREALFLSGIIIGSILGIAISMKKVSDIVTSYLASLGVDVVFMLPGGGSMHLVDSLGREPRLSYVVNLHEQACAIAAEAYGQFTNHLGVALVTTGPGGTNALTGVAAAWLESTPCIFISGQVKRDDLKSDRGVRQFGFQEIDIVSMTQSVTKYSVTITDPNRILYHLQKAYYLATSGRPGPVWLDIPLDVQGAQVDEKELLSFDIKSKATNPQHLLKPVLRTIELLNSSVRPVVLVGNGVRLARAESKLATVLERLNVPVLTTWKALDLFPDNDRLFCGSPGAIGQRGANFVQQNSDWILTLGARLDLGQTGYSHEGFARSAKKIVVDVDPAEIQKLNTEVSVPVASDVGDFLEELNRQSAAIKDVDRRSWLKQCKGWKDKYPVILPEYWSYTDGVSLYVLVDVLSELLKDGDVIVPGSSGACSEVTMQAFRIRSHVRVLNSQGLGAMGFGIPAAIGACLASGKHPTVCIDGDGGFWMNIQDLETVRRLDLPVKFFVLNNDGYGSIRATQNSHFGGALTGAGPNSGLTLPSIRDVCSAFGIQVFRLEHHTDIRERVRAILANPGPAVCEVMVSPKQATAPRLSSSRQPDGRMVSRPLEDLAPFLDRKELKENMLT